MKTKLNIPTKKWLIYPCRSQGGALKFCMGIGHDIASFSSHTCEARGLKIGMHNLYIDGSKDTDQIFDI